MSTETYEITFSPHPELGFDWTCDNERWQKISIPFNPYAGKRPARLCHDGIVEEVNMPGPIGRYSKLIAVFDKRTKPLVDSFSFNERGKIEFSYEPPFISQFTVSMLRRLWREGWRNVTIYYEER